MDRRPGIHDQEASRSQRCVVREIVGNGCVAPASRDHRVRGACAVPANGRVERRLDIRLGIALFQHRDDRAKSAKRHRDGLPHLRKLPFVFHHPERVEVGREIVDGHFGARLG